MSQQRQQNQDIHVSQAHPEAGQITVLIIGYILLALLLTSVVVAVSTVYIEHKKLLSMADGASVAAADSYTLGQMETKAGTPSAVLNGGRVQAVVMDYLTQNDAFIRFDALAVEPSTGSREGSTAVVVLSAVVHPPIVNFLVPDGIAIQAESTARARLSR
ncbi:pilus assembly protein TadG-related protein [Arthrobacter sp.]|uniref:pilus assembly protein TadG-related protein n=1 Tax=Arthrobacter sp. TaxID=1667 RepID=UPI0028115581|nr:pilus assembly protein TadG-related protein [Arthrobacter sp.]